uniref:Uncharacterized protein n=1 Tax=Stegastes partitus TaxID=144197 RepID=A0A3B5AMG6_9TELE
MGGPVRRPAMLTDRPSVWLGVEGSCWALTSHTLREALSLLQPHMDNIKTAFHTQKEQSMFRYFLKLIQFNQFNFKQRHLIALSVER